MVFAFLCIKAKKTNINILGVLKMRKKRLLFLFCLAFLCVLINNAYYKAYYKKVDVSKIALDKVIAIAEEKEIVKDLKEEYQNDEIVGYLRIPNTELKVPVTQANNNSKYLSKDAYGNKDEKGNPFLDYRVNINTSNKLLIFGHNAPRYNAPFKILENYYDKEFYNTHKYIELVTESNIFRYEIFAIYIETGDWSYMKLDYPNSDSRYKELVKYKSKSFYDTGVEITPTDNILILQTCSYKEEYSQYNKKYLLIVSRRVEKE